MSNSLNEETPSAVDVIKALRGGNAEPLAEYIEKCGSDLVFQMMTADDRLRLARALRSGSPLTRSEKRANSGTCKSRDIFLVNRLFYWFGFGAPGFSHTSTDTAFHRAIEEYEKNPYQGAPTRTTESLYRHVWKPYLSRINNNSLSTEDHRGMHRSPLGTFTFGLGKSTPTPEQAKERLLWFEHTLLKPGITFLITSSDAFQLAHFLDYAELPTDRWTAHLTKQS